MKCPNCGKETEGSRMFCGWCNARIREPASSTDSPAYNREPENLSHMEPLIQSDFWRAVVKIGGIVGAFVGAIFAIVGVYGISGGTGVQFTINDKVVSAEEGGQVFLIVGIVVLLVGIVLIYVGFKRKIVQGY